MGVLFLMERWGSALEYGLVQAVPELKKPADFHQRALKLVVPTEGLEPPHLAAHGPEPCASTNSATWATEDQHYKLIQVFVKTGMHLDIRIVR